jgi:hypothetical protein
MGRRRGGCPRAAPPGRVQHWLALGPFIHQEMPETRNGDSSLHAKPERIIALLISGGHPRHPPPNHRVGGALSQGSS